MLPLRLPAPPRGPAVPDAGWLLLAFVLQTFSAIQFQQGALVHMAGEERLVRAAAWGLATLAGYGVAFLGVPLAARVFPSGEGRATWGDWGRFLACIAGFGAIGALFRAWLGFTFPLAAIPHRSPLALAATMTLVCVVCIALLEYLSARQRELTRRRQARADVAAMMTASRAALVATDDAQRRELAELLHGRFQTHMAVARALAIGTGATDPESRSAELRRAAGIVRALRTDALAELTRLEAAPEAPLPQAVAELVERFRAIRPVAWQLDPSVGAAPALKPGLVDAAVRLASEALLNVQRHAGPCALAVSLERRGPAELALVVRDAGRGFAPADARRGLGLAQMGAGLVALGGTWALDAAPGRGTTVTLRLPEGPA